MRSWPPSDDVGIIEKSLVLAIAALNVAAFLIAPFEISAKVFSIM